jgi:cholesterol oxidase
MQPRLARRGSELKARYDAVVVGSGYGAGVAASRLARCGRSVAVLERGKEMRPGDFPDRVSAAARELQVTGPRGRMGAPTALFDIRVNDDVNVLMGCGLGGTSLINANVCLSPDPRVFEDAAWPPEVRSDRLLAEGFLRARHMLRPEVPRDWQSFQKVAALRLAASAVDRSLASVPLHVVEEAGVNAAGVHQAACTQCGDCCAGCNVGAKTTVASTYLADADSFGAEIFTEMQVVYLAKERDGSWRVWLKRGTSEREHSISVRADIVVLGAGTLGSTEILLRSAREGLPISDWLGARFTSNGDAIAFAYNNDVPVNGIGVGNPPKANVPPVGQAVNGLIDLRDKGPVRDGLAIVECALPSALASLVPILLSFDATLFSEREVHRISDGIDALGQATESLIRGAYDGALHATQTFLAVGHDAGNGLMRLKDDRLTIEWSNGPGQRVFQRIEEVLMAAAAATGGRYLRNPALERVFGGNLMTVHPLGGCTMGRDRTSGVVNHKGQVFDASVPGDASTVHRGLYVCDGAVIPCPLGIHPLLTITALAERTMVLLARDWGFEAREEPAPQRSFVAPPVAAASPHEPVATQWFGRWRRDLVSSGRD